MAMCSRRQWTIHCSVLLVAGAQSVKFLLRIFEIRTAGSGHLRRRARNSLLGYALNQEVFLEELNFLAASNDKQPENATPGSPLHRAMGSNEFQEHSGHAAANAGHLQDHLRDEAGRETVAENDFNDYQEHMIYCEETEKKTPTRFLAVIR